MNSLTGAQVSSVLARLFGEASVTDAPYIARLLDSAPPGTDPLAGVLDAEALDYAALYHDAVDNFLCVSPEFGRLLYVCARACRAARIVEFGTSFGISTIHLACALRDNAGGTLIGTELEPTKARRADANLEAAGLAEFVDIRVGDALETLRDDVADGIDVVHLDGALSLYRPVLALLEPRLGRNALILAENATADYLQYVRDPRNGYVSLPLPFEPARGNELSLFTG